MEPGARRGRHAHHQAAAAGNDAAFERLWPAQKVAVLAAQNALYSEASFYKDGKRRAPNVVSIFRPEHPHNTVFLVEQPQPGVIPQTMGRALVVRRELNAESELTSSVP